MRRYITYFIGFLGLMPLSLMCFAEWYQQSNEIMGTEVSVQLWYDNPAQSEAQQKNAADIAIGEVMAIMRGIDQRLSPYISTSEVYKINAEAAHQPQKISKELVKLIDKSLYFSQVTQGAFDITFASVGWYYDYREQKQPDEKLRQSLLPAINYKLLDLDREKSTLYFQHKNVRIDLGGVAKGYAVDLAAEKLKTLGIHHASISAGGDTRILGDKLGRPWVVGIRNPRKQEADATPVILLPVVNSAVSTSGDYERYFIDESGARVHHIINPKTGTSAREVVSVTVIGPSGFDTDPLSTSVFVLGVERGLALVNQIPGFDCVIIDRFGQVHYSKELMSPEDLKKTTSGIKNEKDSG